MVENKDRYLERRYFFDEWDKAFAARRMVKQQRELYRERPDYRKRLGALTWDLDGDMQSDHFVGNLAQWWVKTHPPEQPLLLQVGFPGPHPPYDPTPEALEPYQDRDVPLQPVTQEDLDGQPKAYQGMRVHNHEVDHDSVVHVLYPTEAQRLDQRRHCLANLTLNGTKVGEILDALLQWRLDKGRRSAKWSEAFR